MTRRCNWANEHPLLTEYHDTEWGVPVHDDRKLFEFLVLDAMQAGLSWLTVLKKRENFRKAFADFDVNKVARYRKAKIDSLLRDKGIIRNRLKVESSVANARALLKVQEEFGSFDAYIWGFVGGKTISKVRKSMDDLPAETPESAEMSKALKKRGFRFVGPTICYAFMQAAGLVNDHVLYCFRRKELRQQSKR